jgi:hypothetical protein
MKVLLCGKCFDIRAFDPNGAWTVCRCGNVQARWLDPHRGTVRVKAKDPRTARIIGLNNSFLYNALDTATGRALTMNEDWRDAHDQATNAPGYVFDKSSRACWACIVEVGQTGDISWEPEVETETPT